MSKASVYEAKTENFIQPILDSMNFELVDVEYVRSEERRVGKECRSRWSPYH